jgi:hypothetical protein
MELEDSRNDWNNMLHSFLSANATAGTSWSVKLTAEVPVGRGIPSNYEFIVAEKKRFAGKDCLRVTFISTPDAKAQAEYLQTLMSGIGRKHGFPDEPWTSDTIVMSGRGEFIIDPSTMRFYKKTETWKFHVAGHFSGSPKFHVFIQRLKGSRFTYMGQPSPSDDEPVGPEAICPIQKHPVMTVASIAAP